MLTHNIYIHRHICRLSPQCKPTRASVLFNIGRGTTPGVISARLCVGDKNCQEVIYQSNFTINENSVGKRNRLGRVSKRAERSFEGGHGGCVLTRQTTGCLSIRRQDSTSGEMTTGRRCRELKSHSHWFTTVMFSSDGQPVASASNDKAVHECGRQQQGGVATS